MWKALVGWWKRRRRGKNISILVPFRPNTEYREMVWKWLELYYRHQLPKAQILVSSDDGLNPFCKTMAFNNAFRRARGDIIVLLDADCMLPGKYIQSCANRIRKARKAGHKLWFIPYRRFYRLSEEITADILASNPRHPFWIPEFPDSSSIEPDSFNSASHGHWFGALIQIMPREAFELVGGMDERFRSWGSEDVSFMRAVDTLYVRHHTSNNQVYHLWHPKLGKSHSERRWAGGSAHNNDWLAQLYINAAFNPGAMRELISVPEYRSR